MIDIHIHGFKGLDTTTKSVKDIDALSSILFREGVTAYLPTLYPSELKTMREQMSIIKEAMQRQKAQKDKAKILGVNLEGPFLNPQRAGALDSRYFLPATEYNLDALLDGFEDVVKIITVAPELNGALRIIKKASDRGIVVSLGHSDATYAQAESAYDVGAKGLTHLFNAMRGIHHREPGLAGFGLLHKDIYIEIIADPYHLHPKTLEMVFRVKEPERIIVVSDSIKNSKTGQEDISDKRMLQGGAYSLKDSCARLRMLDINEAHIKQAVLTNPVTYLSLKIEH